MKIDPDLAVMTLENDLLVVDLEPRGQQEWSCEENCDKFGLCDLPDELILKILSYLTLSDLAVNVACVNQRMR